MDIEQSLEAARIPSPMVCGECDEKLYSPMDKLSISLYGKCSVHFEEGSFQEKNLLTLSSAI